MRALGKPPRGTRRRRGRGEVENRGRRRGRMNANKIPFLSHSFGRSTFTYGKRGVKEAEEGVGVMEGEGRRVTREVKKV